MNSRLFSTLAIALAITVPAFAQDAPATAQPSTPAAGQSGAQTPAQSSDNGSGRWQGRGQGQGQGQRGGRGGGMGQGRGLIGTVTEVAADHYTIKTDAGDSYTVHFDANTRMIKQVSRQGQGQGQGEGRGQGQGEGGGQGGWQGRQRGEGGGGGFGGAPPVTIKPTDIKVGDAIVAMGEIDAATKSVAPGTIAQLDPERAKQMREMQANYGKTWLMGKITAVDGVKVTIMGSVDNLPHVFVADENTSFRKRRDLSTLADLEVGDSVRIEGAIKDGAFLATTVNAMGGPPAGNRPPPAGNAASPGRRGGAPSEGVGNFFCWLGKGGVLGGFFIVFRAGGESSVPPPRRTRGGGGPRTSGGEAMLKPP